jgi:polyferredoxin
LPKWQRFAQPVMLALVVAVALILRAVGASGAVAAALAIAFGLVGVACMVFWSRRLGAMTHCTLFCPMGWLATRVGRRISPFDMRIAPGCDACHACLTQCRFGALTPADVARGRPGPSCTLCGDCVRACKDRVMTYRLLGWEGDRARTVFLVVIVSLHAVFLGVARI